MYLFHDMRGNYLSVYLLSIDVPLWRECRGTLFEAYWVDGSKHRSAGETRKVRGSKVGYNLLFSKRIIGDHAADEKMAATNNHQMQVGSWISILTSRSSISPSSLCKHLSFLSVEDTLATFYGRNSWHQTMRSSTKYPSQAVYAWERIRRKSKTKRVSPLQII